MRGFAIAHKQKAKQTMKLEGTWHITEMDMWDEDYFNMDVQAYITINGQGSGDFQFGLVSGSMDGDIISGGPVERIEFTWEGNDESDAAFGSGWISLKTESTVEGMIKIHEGDRSTFTAERA